MTTHTRPRPRWTCLATHAAGMIPIMVPDLKQPDDAVRRLAYAVVPILDDHVKSLRR